MSTWNVLIGPDIFMNQRVLELSDGERNFLQYLEANAEFPPKIAHSRIQAMKVWLQLNPNVPYHQKPLSIPTNDQFSQYISSKCFGDDRDYEWKNNTLYCRTVEEGINWKCSVDGDEAISFDIIPQKVSTWKILPHPKMRFEIIYNEHRQGHISGYFLKRILSMRYHWRGMSKDISMVVKHCPECCSLSKLLNEFIRLPEDVLKKVEVKPDPFARSDKAIQPIPLGDMKPLKVVKLEQEPKSEYIQIPSPKTYPLFEAKYVSDAKITLCF
jgi:hypothetical protein